MRITCPFGPHSGLVSVLGVGSSALIEQHRMSFPSERTLMCPASLMHWPLGDAERAALAQQARDMARQFQRDIISESEQLVPPPIPQDWAATPKGLIHIFCATKHTPSQKCPGPKSHPVGGRGDRDPGPQSDDWALGGRADEDVIPHHEVVEVPIPGTVQGQSIGRGTVSATEHAQAARKAIGATDEAAQAIMEAQSKIGQARSIVAELLGDGTGETLTAWLVGLNEIADSLEKTARGTDLTNASGEQFIGNVMS